MISRRNFCKTCGLMSMSGALAPAFLARTVASTPSGLAGNKRALVVVQMTGGNDGLNTVVPYTDGAYYKARPTLGLKEAEILKLDQELGLNPALKELKGLYDNGQVAIVRGVGYPNPSYSHFRSMEIWQSANPDLAPRDGWLGRYLASESRQGNPDALTRLGMTVGSTGQGGGAPLAFWTEKTVVLSFGGLERFQFRADPANRGDRAAQLAAARQIYSLATGNQAADYVRKTALDALNASEQLEKMAASYRPAATYPKNGFADRLKAIAQILDADYGTRVFYVATDGSFDTHFNQAGSHGRLLGLMSEALDAFYKDLAAHNLADAVLTLTFSEFGRRVSENGSRGTDHGSAGPVFVIGGKNAIRPGLYGQQPSLANLDDGNLRSTVDFRSVYSSVLKNWLATEPAPIVGGDFPLLDFVR